MKKSVKDGLATGAELGASREQAAGAWDTIIRAYYLAHEMRYFCMAPNMPMPEVTQAAAAALEAWATRLGAELEAGKDA
jgi:hypothetical protein